jgi:hypothetical protein
MSTRTATWLAWALCALSLTALSLLLLVLNLSHPDAHVYDYWLENTLTAISNAPVGALIASHRPVNSVGWLLCLYGLAISVGHFSSQYAIYTLLAQPNSPQVKLWPGSRPGYCPSLSAFRYSHTYCSLLDGYRAGVGGG